MDRTRSKNIIPENSGRRLNLKADAFGQDEALKRIQGRYSPASVLLSGDDLLTEAIGLFLVESGSWDVIRVSNDKCVVKLIQDVTRVKPDVVILCQDRVGGEAVLPMRLIGAHLCPKVVTLSLDSNLMQVYSKHDFMLQGTLELLSIIESGKFLNCKSGKEENG